MSLFDITLAAILSLPGTSAPADRPRLEELAGAIVFAVEDREMAEAWLPGAAPLPFGGPHAAEASAIGLVSLAYGESRFAAEVADCRRVGVDFPSITMWQLHSRWAFGPFSRDELCSSPHAAAKRALWVLAHHGAKCLTPAAAFRGFASGDCGRDSKAAREHCRRWERLGARAGLALRCGRREGR